MDEIVHLRKLSTRNVGHDAVKRVVTHRLVGCLAHPGVKGLAQGLAFILNREIDQRSRASESGGPSTRFEIVSTRSPSKRHVKMRVHIDASRQHESPTRVDQVSRILRWQILPDCRNL